MEGIVGSPAPNGGGTVWQITPTTRDTTCPGNSASTGCQVGALVDPRMTVASPNVPLIAPNTEFGDPISRLDLNVTRTFKFNRSASSRSSIYSTR
jgi:hypothetical protein